MKETKFVGVGPNISPEMYQQWAAYQKEKEQVSPEVSLLQKYSPYELGIALHVASHHLESPYAPPHVLSTGEIMLLGKPLTHKELTVLTGWANDTEGPPDMVKEWLKLDGLPPDPSVAAMKLLEEKVISVETAKQLMGIKDEPAHPTAQAFEQGYWGSFAPKPGPNPFGDDIGDSED
jgi:hypothetical protein